MLALTRKANQTILIGPDIAVKVLQVRNGQVRLGFSAPNDVNIVREELVIKQEEKLRKHLGE